MCKISGAGNREDIPPAVALPLTCCSFPSKHVCFTGLVHEGESDGEPGV